MIVAEEPKDDTGPVAPVTRISRSVERPAPRAHPPRLCHRLPREASPPTLRASPQADRRSRSPSARAPSRSAHRNDHAPQARRGPGRPSPHSARPAAIGNRRSRPRSNWSRSCATTSSRTKTSSRTRSSRSRSRSITLPRRARSRRADASTPAFSRAERAGLIQATHFDRSDYVDARELKQPMSPNRCPRVRALPIGQTEHVRR